MKETSRPRKTGRSAENSKAEPVRGAQVRYAVVGLGYIAQQAVLPAFAHARKNSRLAALVSDEPGKLRQLARHYEVARTFSFEQFDACLNSGEIDAVFIALPNSLHCEYAIRAAAARIHVLCEKPMAVTEEECERMIQAAGSYGVRLMIGYRLHFEAANLAAIAHAQSGKLGELRLFDSVFTMQVKDKQNIRLDRRLGGGVLYDIGIYCINAARYLFRDEPVETFAWSANNGEPRFAEVEEMYSVVLRFPGERLANFSASFGASDVSSYRLVGTRGDLVVERAYEYAEDIQHRLTIGGQARTRSFKKRDQFAPELLYFSQCIKDGHKPEPSGAEGLADVRIIRALLRSAEIGNSVELN